jgi:hypothetical protein
MKMLLILGDWLNRHQARKSYLLLVTLTKMLLILWNCHIFTQGTLMKVLLILWDWLNGHQDSEAIFAFTCLYENITFCRGLAKRDPGVEVIFAFRARMKMLQIL